MSFSDKQISRAAKKHFDQTRHLSNKSQPKRGLIRRLVDNMFDPNLSFIDVAQRVKDEITEDSDARAMEACIRKIEELAAQGWYHTVDQYPLTSLGWGSLSIQIAPHAVLQNDSQICLLYAYFRQTPPLGTDGIRSLLSLLRTFPDGHIYRNARIVILDCYRDKSFEDSEFEPGERWIARQIEKVLTRYNSSYHAYLDGGPPTFPSSPDLTIQVQRPLQIRSDIGSGDNESQLSFLLA